MSLTNGGEIVNGFYIPRGKNLQTEAEGKKRRRKEEKRQKFREIEVASHQ